MSNIDPIDFRPLIFKQDIKSMTRRDDGGGTASFNLSDPDERGVRKFTAVTGEELGEFHLLGPVPEDGLLQAPDDGRKSIVFPTMAGVVRYIGPLERAICMFVMHKVNRIVPMTPDLAKMARVFDAHEEFSTSWAFRELSVNDVLGAGGAEYIANLAVERGLAVRKNGKYFKRRTRG